MEKKLENMALTEEALDEVTGGIIDNAPTMGMARYSMQTEQNLDVAHNLILDEMAAPSLGAQGDAVQLGLVQEVQQNIF